MRWCHQHIIREGLAADLRAVQQHRSDLGGLSQQAGLIKFTPAAFHLAESDRGSCCCSCWTSILMLVLVLCGTAWYVSTGSALNKSNFEARSQARCFKVICCEAVTLLLSFHKQLVKFCRSNITSSSVMSSYRCYRKPLWKISGYKIMMLPVMFSPDVWQRRNRDSWNKSSRNVRIGERGLNRVYHGLIFKRFFSIVPPLKVMDNK